MLFTYLACVFLTPSARPSVKMVKKAFFELKKHGLPDAKVVAGVVLWVATTSFGEKTGSETNIPVVRHISSGRRQVLLPVAFLRVLSGIR